MSCISGLSLSFLYYFHVHIHIKCTYFIFMYFTKDVIVSYPDCNRPETIPQLCTEDPSTVTTDVYEAQCAFSSISEFHVV